MAEPIWREIAKVRVPEGIGKGDAKAQWTLAMELVPSGKLLKLEIITDPETPDSGTWRPRGLTGRVTADGDFKKCDKSVTQLLKTAPCGGAHRADWWQRNRSTHIQRAGNREPCLNDCLFGRTEVHFQCADHANRFAVPGRQRRAIRYGRY